MLLYFLIILKFESQYRHMWLLLHLLLGLLLNWVILIITINILPTTIIVIRTYITILIITIQLLLL